MEPQIGSTIGDYQVIGILGAGGMGKVYKVRNTISDRVEAMKVLLPDLASAPDLADRFLREIKVQASLEHPNIAALHTAVRIENQLVMLMEFVDGVTLEQKLKDGPLPVAQAVDYITQVLAALEFAHARGVIHRDIKPANMMLTPGGVVKLMDFGIAKAASDQKLTMTGTTLGSLYYMSPEQIQGATTLDARADLYSMGVSLYELVTGKRPFDGDSQFAIMSAHLQNTPVPPIQLDPKLPQALNDVILMSVMKDPAARFQTAKAFRNALGNVMPAPRAAAVAPAVPAPPPQAVHAIEPTVAVRPKSRRGVWMAIGALAAVAVAVGVVELAPWKGTKAQSVTQIAQPAAPAAAPAAAPEAASAQPATVPALPPHEAAHAVGRAASRQAPAMASQAQPAAQAPQPAPPQQPAAASPAPAPSQPDTSRAELQDLREELVVLDNRAQGIRGTLSNLQRAQAASGYGLGSQYTGPAGLMESYLRGAGDALNAGDAAAARRFLEKAKPPIAALEKLLNK
jgi:serine/threonine-protein kinase